MPVPRERFAVSENAARYKKHSVVFLCAFPFTGPEGIRAVAARVCCHGSLGSVDGIRMGAPRAGHPVLCNKVGQEAERMFARGAPPTPLLCRPALRANHGTRGPEISPVCLDLGPRAWWRGREGGETALPRSKGIG